MARNQNSVAILSADNLNGPLLYNPSLTVNVADDTDYKTGGWLLLGYAATDGISVEQSVERKDKKVWGTVLGTVYSDFKDVVTIHSATLLDEDVCGVVFGAGNVTTDAAGKVHVKAKPRQGTEGTFVILATTDSGDAVRWVYRGKTNPAVKYDVSDGDILSYELEITGKPDTDLSTSELVFPKADTAA